MLAEVRAYPVLWTVLISALICFPFALPLAEGELSGVASWLLIVDVQAGGDVNLARLAADLEPWRWMGPVFLHFSLQHLLFNVALAVFLGRIIETGLGGFGMLLLIVVLAVSSNVAQLVWQSTPFFGGLSGVVYGFAGFLIVMSSLRSADFRWQVHRGVLVMMVVLLVVMSTGITEFFGTHIANGAHWGGFLMGIVAGGAAHALLRHPR